MTDGIGRHKTRHISDLGSSDRSLADPKKAPAPGQARWHKKTFPTEVLVKSRCFCSSGSQGCKTMRTAVTASKNYPGTGQRPRNGVQDSAIGPDSPPFRVWATWPLTQARIFVDAAARSTFQPATLCRITRNTLPRPRTLSRFNPSRFFKPLLVDSIPERRAYRSVNTGVSCSRAARPSDDPCQ